MFYDNYVRLCNLVGKAPSAVAVELGFQKAAVTRWKKGGNPTDATVQKIADYFGVTTDYLLTGEETEKAPTLTDKDERDIARDVERIMSNLETSGDLMFDGVPMSQEAKESMAAAMKLGLEAARLKNKETYTPKKYKKE